MILLLLAAIANAGAPDDLDPEADFARAPLDHRARLDWALALAAEPEHLAEAMEALAMLRDDLVVGEEANVALGHLADRPHPTAGSDPALAAARARASLAASDTKQAVALIHGALGATSFPADRQMLSDLLVEALVRDADIHRADGDLASARTSALMALAMRPDEEWVEKGAAGLLWEMGEQGGARALYLRVVETDPTDLDARVSAAALAWWAGEAEACEALLVAVPPDREDVRALRAQMARVLRLDASRAIFAEPDPVIGEARFRALLEEDPREPAFLLGLADALVRQGRIDEAFPIIRDAATLAPRDPWPILAEVNALAAGGELEEARERLADLPVSLPDEARVEAAKVRARVLRAGADEERGAGRLGAALIRYTEAAHLDPNPWNLIGLASLYAERGEEAEALALFERVEREAKGSAREVAIRGRAGVLEATGRQQDARDVLEALFAQAPTETNRAALEGLAERIAVSEADALRRDGDLAGAESLVGQMAMRDSGSADVLAALAAIRLDRGDAAGAVATAIRAFTRDPVNAWALDTARRAARSCGCAATVVPYFRVAATSGSKEAKARLPGLRASAAAERANALIEQGRPRLAVAELAGATADAQDDAGALLLVARAWDRLGRHRKARAAYTRAIALEASNVEAVLVGAEVERRALQLDDAERVLREGWERTKHPAIAQALARIRMARGHARAALSGLDGLPKEEAERLRTEILQTTRPWASPGLAMVRSSGAPDTLGQVAWLVPVDLGLPPIGTVATQVEAVFVDVDDGAHRDSGVAPSLAFSTPDSKPLAASVRVGTSPIGFAGGVYPTWNAGLRVHPASAVTLGVESGRVPLADSVASWAGQRDALTGVMFGSASFTWAGGLLSWGSPAGGDAGFIGRAGWADGLSMEPDARADAAVWAGHDIGDTHRGVRLGVEGVFQANDHQADAFEEGGGAYWSPPLFGGGSARVDVRWHGGILGMCGAASAGIQHATGEDTPWFAAGTLFTTNGRAAVSVDLGGAWRLDLAGTWLTAGPTWNQETGILRIGWGVTPRPWNAASPLSTLSVPGGGLLYTGNPC